MIQVLLSTYNGAAYLPPLLDSLLAQTLPPQSILVRDDGSTDETVSILEHYASHHPCFQIHVSENLGVTRSFATLLEMASDDSHYLAFCDQDDVWLPTKIEHAVSQLSDQPSDVPIGYFCRMQLVDENLNLLRLSDVPSRPAAFANALVQNIATGCTQVFNQAARQLILSRQPDWSRIFVHDWWLYMIVTAFGQMIYDPQPQILYRQHSSNAIGMKGAMLESRLKRFAANQHSCIGQAKIIQETFGDILPAYSRKILDRFLNGQDNLLSRLNYVFTGEAYRQKWFDDLIFKGLYLLDRV
jgi:glycosyltransferase involved in cell wall biosynthesis